MSQDLGDKKIGVIKSPLYGYFIEEMPIHEELINEIIILSHLGIQAEHFLVPSINKGFKDSFAFVKNTE